MWPEPTTDEVAWTWTNAALGAGLIHVAPKDQELAEGSSVVLLVLLVVILVHFSWWRHQGMVTTKKTW